jgi:hypothetical protein
MRSLHNIFLKTAVCYVMLSSIFSTLCIGQNIPEHSNLISDTTKTLSKPFNLLDKQYTFFTEETEGAVFWFFQGVTDGIDSIEFSPADGTVRKYISDSLGIHEAIRVDLDLNGRPYHVHFHNHSSELNGFNNLCLQTGKRNRLKYISLGLDSNIIQRFTLSNSGQLIEAEEFIDGEKIRNINFYYNLLSRSKLKHISDYFDDISNIYENFNIDAELFTRDFLRVLGRHSYDYDDDDYDYDDLDYDDNKSSEIRAINAICEWTDGKGEVTVYYYTGEKSAYGNVDEQGNLIGTWTHLKKSGEIKKIKEHGKMPKLL